MTLHAKYRLTPLYQPRYQNIGQIMGTNTTRILSGTDALSVAIDLLDAHVTGAPVTDHEDHCVGFVSEFDLLKAVQNKSDLQNLTVDDIMTRQVEAVSPSTSIEEAIRLMEEKHLLNLPVVENGVLFTTVRRHDLLRVVLGFGLVIEESPRSGLSL